MKRLSHENFLRMAISKLNTVVQKNYFQDLLPNEIMIYIFKYVKSSVNLAVSCKKWYVIAKDWQAKLEWIIFQYGRQNCLSNAAKLGFKFINSINATTERAIIEIIPEE